ncbi:Replication factor C subunit 1 [Orchesella cincta]|uniref:Replication factor C subunit 1 n=1 Tax=Orchesella cincta TaxID=48709 RepID=A0A1D2N0D5_ORCCI|nr:Replication factor C subunit 1 [Orchesella cincta]
MKVTDIRSFFNKPGGSTQRASRSTSAAPAEIVEVPSRLKKGGSKKKSKKDEHLNVSIENSDDSDREDPLPKKVRKGDKDNGKSKSRKPVIEDDDDGESDGEDPIPKADRSKRKEDKKRKARVLSDSDEEDFKPSKGKSTAVEKPAAKVAKIEKVVESKKKQDLKPVNPADFFGGGPVKRETNKDKKGDDAKVKSASKPETPEKKPTEKKSTDNKSSPQKEKVSTPPSSSKAKHNGTKESSPHRPPTSLIEPKKLKMPTPTPEKEEKKHSISNKGDTSSPTKKIESKSKKTPEKQEQKFKAPTPVTKEKSKPRTAKRSIPENDEDEEEDFNPKKKPTPKGSTSKEKPSSRKRDKTPSTDADGEEKKATDSAAKQNYLKYLTKKDIKPKNLGTKDIPVGAPDCLKGQTFVMSGVLDSLEREDCKALIVKYGGKVTTSVSGKTTYLIIGDDPGESKIDKAKQLKVPQITEDDLLEMIRKSNPNGNSQDSGLHYSEDMIVDSEQMRTESEYDPDVSLFETPSKKTTKTDLSPKKPESVNQAEKVETKSALSSSSTVVPAANELMWVDKYKPKTIKNVVGQATDKSNARKLVQWLENWFKYHGTSQDKPKASWPGLRDPEGKTFKAALLSGPPGIGKTTTAHLAVREVGYDYFELNASDTRNKRGLHENVADALSSKSLVFGKNEELSRKHVLIMDEVDGMSGNEDRGGVQELIALIKTSRVPLICICNDRNHTKIRSLANYCFDLRFNKPSFEQLKAFVSKICFMEKMKIPQERVKQLIISTDNDVRQILHQMELFKEGNSDQAYNPRKDLKFGPWEVIRKVFLKSDHDKMSIHDKNALFFQDYNIGPLFVQENYPKWVPAAAKGCRYKHMDLLAKTASSIADADLVDSVIRKSQNWSLLPVQGVFASYIPGEYMESDTVGGVDFPQWLGKNSNRGKRHRLLQSLHTHLHLHVSGSLEALNMDYLPYLRRAITKPLAEGDHESAAGVMEQYTLLRDDVESINDLSVWPGTRDPMERVESKVKAAFTRLVNKEMLPYSNAKTVKKGRGGGTATQEEEDMEALLEEEGAPAEEEEEDESIEKDAMVKVRTRKAASSKASSSAAKGKKGKKTIEDSDDEMDVKKSSKGKQTSKSRKGK